MTGRVVASAALLALVAVSVLAGCATSPVGPAPIIEVTGCTGLSTQPVVPQPRLPDAATVPAPTSEAEAEGLALFLEHVATLAAWGREGWGRVEAQRQACTGQPSR